MSTTVCLGANTIAYPEGGGHRWVYLNWALGLRAIGCEVIWLEMAPKGVSAARIRAHVASLRAHLEPYGLGRTVALFSCDDPLPRAVMEDVLDLDSATEADLLLNLEYGAPVEVVSRFKRSALIDIDPGLLQVWMSKGWMQVAPHDVCFTIGETVGQPGARFPDAGLDWRYTPPCVALDRWPLHPAGARAPFTTISHWHADEWMGDDGDEYLNDKRSGFLPFLDLPTRVSQPLELALCLGSDEERAELEERGWRVRHSYDVASTPWDYQHYVQQSRGEFSCVKPSCVRLQNAWVSDRTLCYLASGKPAVIEHTGPSQFLPDAEGLFRFRTIDEAARALETLARDYDRQCQLARELAEEYFEARAVVGHVLEQALG